MLSHPKSGWKDDFCNTIFIANPTNALWSAVVQPSSSSGLVEHPEVHPEETLHTPHPLEICSVLRR